LNITVLIPILDCDVLLVLCGIVLNARNSDEQTQRPLWGQRLHVGFLTAENAEGLEASHTHAGLQTVAFFQPGQQSIHTFLRRNLKKEEKLETVPLLFQLWKM
jgi:hypothetical protein